MRRKRKSFLQLPPAHFLNRPFFLGIFSLFLPASPSHISRSLLRSGGECQILALGPKTGWLLRPRRTPFSGHLGPRRKALSPCARANDGKAFYRATHRVGVSGFGTEATPNPPAPREPRRGAPSAQRSNNFSHLTLCRRPGPKRAERSRCQRSALGPGPVAPITASTAPHRPGAADGPPEPALLSTPRGRAGTFFCLGHPFPQGGKSRLVSPCVSIKLAGRRSAVR